MLAEQIRGRPWTEVQEVMVFLRIEAEDEALRNAEHETTPADPMRD